jgi:hypothetical protein
MLSKVQKHLFGVVINILDITELLFIVLIFVKLLQYLQG